jgi:peptidoglycan hydrolase-like protein with peptidoglycan-binding domain
MRYTDFKIAESIPKDVVGNKMDKDNSVFDMEGGLEAGPPYPQDQVEAIKQLQTELQRLGYSVGSTGIDGKYGPRTSRAVKAFQKDFGQATPPNANFAGGAITADGIKALQSAKPVDKPTPTGNEGSGGGSGIYDLPPLSDRSDVQGAVGGVLDFIAQYESRGLYDMRNGGTRDRRILDMTIAEVLQYQRSAPWPDGESSAIGRYQYVRATLEWVTGQMGVNRNTQKFDEAFQDRLCIFDARRRCRLDQWLNGSIDSTTFSHQLAQVWSSIPNRNNRSAHLGIGSNRRGINLDQSVAQLDAIRTGLA